MSRSGRKPRSASGRTSYGRYTPPATRRVLDDRRVAWYAPIYNVSGYADEARNFIRLLRRLGVDVAAQALGPVDSSFVEQLGRDDEATAHALLSSQRRGVTGAPVSVLHVTGDVADADLGSRVRVVRTMYETDRLPELWVEKLNTVDEIWVPSHFNAETFSRSGVTTPIEIVPGGVDTDVFHPGLLPLPIAGAHGTIFLSVFEWSHRKGPDVLLRAFAEAFTSACDVTLVLRAFPRGHFTSLDATAAVERLVDAELANIGVRRSDCATIVVLGQHLSGAELPRLIRTADAYVSPTRGEGWGRPLMEAMACGRPVLATAWSAQRDFLDEENSLPVRVDRLIKVDEAMDVAHYRGHYWAEPSSSHLAERLAFVHTHPDQASLIGERARRDAVTKWQWGRAAKIAKHRLDVLLDAETTRGTHSGTKSQHRQGKTRVRVVGDLDALHSLARVNRELVAGLRGVAGLAVEAVATDRGAPVARTPQPGIEIRHHWPPDFSPPGAGTTLVMIMPWELGVIPKNWVKPLQDVVDEVWTYSSYTRRSFLAAGLPETMIHVVPLGVDTELFCLDGPRYPLATSKTLRFLYLGGTIPRKGFDLALSAYLDAFDRTDDVCLVVKPFLSLEHYRGMNLDSVLASAALDHSNPEIEVIEETNLTDTDLAALYRACDVLIAPYRGEGFGLPILEAMACGVPAVVTDHGAALDFCDKETSYLVPASEVPVTVASGEAPARGQFTWAEPDTVALSAILRSVCTERTGRQSRASAGISQAWRYSWAETAIVAAERLTVVGQRRAKSGAQRGRGARDKSERPLLSAAMIVKDEEAHLTACLSTIVDLVDEVVIGDTGSSDATETIARSTGAKVINVAWTDDFAAARNEVLRHCAGRWILSIDADERFEGDPSLVRASLEAASSAAFLVPIENLEANGIESSTTHNAVRLFSSGLFFSGRVHEQVVRRDAKPLVAPLIDHGRLVHLGYLSAAFDKKDKRTRNLALAELALAEAKSPDSRAEAEMNLGRSHLLAGHHDLALSYLERASTAKNATVARASLHTAALAAISAGDFTRAGNYVEALRSRCHTSVLADILAGTIACGTGRYEESLQILLPYSGKVEDDDHVLRGGSDVAPLLARCYRSLGDRGAAGDIALKELRATGRYQEPLAVVIADLKLAGRDLRDLGRSLPERALKLFLAQLLTVEPDDGLVVLDGVLDSHPTEMAVLAAAGAIAARASVALALQWSVRLAAAGIADRPILDLARDTARPLCDRALAAASAHRVFPGSEPIELLTSLLETASSAQQTELAALLAPILDAELTAADAPAHELVG